jgi:hypothetical protein
MSTKYGDLIKAFDKQIKVEYRINNGEIEECESYWAKSLFIAANNLSIDDWRQIRDKDYWRGYDCRRGIERKRFTLDRIKQYNKKHN